MKRHYATPKKKGHRTTATGAAAPPDLEPPKAHDTAAQTKSWAFVGKGGGQMANRQGRSHPRTVLWPLAMLPRPIRQAIRASLGASKTLPSHRNLGRLCCESDKQQAGFKSEDPGTKPQSKPTRTCHFGVPWARELVRLFYDFLKFKINSDLLFIHF